MKHEPGIAHIQLSVTDFPRSRAFYRALCEHFEMHCRYDVPDPGGERATLYYIGGKTGLLIRSVNPEHASDRFHQYKPGCTTFAFARAAAVVSGQPVLTRIGQSQGVGHG